MLPNTSFKFHFIEGPLVASERSETALGIDLGTTYSVIAHLDADGRPWTVPNSEGDNTTPSVVFFDQPSVVVGKEAVKVAEHEPDLIAQFTKRDMGRRVYERTIRGEQFPPEVIQALILQKLKHDAELKLGSVTKAVVTVPAYFNEPMRKATQDAGRLAGIEVLDIINEPTAAAISFGVQQGFLNSSGSSDNRETILVYDLGGGTFDATLMEIEGHSYKAVATLGDVFLGGIDWDRRIVDYIAEEFQQQFGTDPRDDASAMQVMMSEAADAKHSLTAREEVTLRFSHDGNRLRLNLTREQFESMTGDLLDRTQFTIRRLLQDSKREWSDVTRLLLVGGSTRMPMIHRMLESESGLPLDRSLSPDEAVAHGAAIYAGLLVGADEITRHGMSVANVNSHDLSVLGVESATGMKRRQVMIPRNTSLPAMGTNRFKTYQDNQASVAVNVIEGGDASGNNATRIGKCVVTDLPESLPAKTPVEVVFKYSQNGRLTVKAWLPTINRKAQLTIERASGLTEAEIEKWAQRIANGFTDDPKLKVTEGRSQIREKNREPATSEDSNPTTAKSKANKPTKSVSSSDSVRTKPAPPKSKAKPKPVDEPQPEAAPVIDSEATDVPQETPVAENPTNKVPLDFASAWAGPTGETAAEQEVEIEEDSQALVPATAEVSSSKRIKQPETPQGFIPRVLLYLGETPNQRKRNLKVWGINTGLHVLVFVILALIILPSRSNETFALINSAFDTQEQAEEIEQIEIEQQEIEDTKMEVVNDVLFETNEQFEVNINDLDPAALIPDTVADAPGSVAPPGSEPGGRSKAGRTALVNKYGGTAASETAVDKGLAWLARHQESDGSWSFDHSGGTCLGQCSQPGSMAQSKMGATSMAVLAFMGAGNTYADGDFQPEVLNALKYIFANAQATPEGLDLRGEAEGNSGMYIQGMATMALCEALAMTELALANKSKVAKKLTKGQRRARLKLLNDTSDQLRAAAQQATLFVMNAQHTQTGSWGYAPKAAGDTSVTGWQVMAMVSAAANKLTIRPEVYQHTTQFLDSVQIDDGAAYGYKAPERRPSTTAIGLLCRMYMGWKKDQDALKRGVTFLGNTGPSKTDMYYNYYATQVMFHFGGEAWKKWNDVMRDQLVNSQIKSGHADGSWDVVDAHGKGPGGRLYMTCMAAMTLEVYYRHLPIYQHFEIGKGKKTKTGSK